MKHIHLSFALVLGLVVSIIPPALAFTPGIDDPDPDPLDVGILRFIEVEHPGLRDIEPELTPPFRLEAPKSPITMGYGSRPSSSSPAAILGAGTTQAGISNGTFLNASSLMTNPDHPEAGVEAAVRDARRKLDRAE
jgi:hypothetical protein